MKLFNHIFFSILTVLAIPFWPAVLHLFFSKFLRFGRSSIYRFNLYVFSVLALSLHNQFYTGDWALKSAALSVATHAYYYFFYTLYSPFLADAFFAKKLFPADYLVNIGSDIYDNSDINDASDMAAFKWHYFGCIAYITLFHYGMDMLEHIFIL